MLIQQAGRMRLIQTLLNNYAITDTAGHPTAGVAMDYSDWEDITIIIDSTLNQSITLLLENINTTIVGGTIGAGDTASAKEIDYSTPISAGSTVVINKLDWHLLECLPGNQWFQVKATTTAPTTGSIRIDIYGRYVGQ